MAMKIGIYGGAFNPIHNGHLHVLRAFAERLQLSTVLVIPTYVSPHKRSAQLASPKDRLVMCELAVAEDNNVMKVSDLEIRRGGTSYTAVTLKELACLYPGAELILLMGEDMFLTLRQWKMPEIIFKFAKICVAPRSVKGLGRLEELRDRLIYEYDAHINFEQISFLDISSTEIRRRVQAGERIEGLVPWKVEEYIHQKKIYQQEAKMISINQCEAAIKPHLSAQRFHHSRCVSEAAVKLAERYGADPEKAAVAGMLHDIMKDTPSDAQLKILDRFDIILSDTEKKLPKLLHAISGAVYIEHYLDIDDPEILGAVRWHTSGRANMTLLEKVIFIADFISEDRNYPGVESMREAAQKSLELAMFEGIKFTVEELMNLKKYVEPQTIAAYNDILSELLKK